MLHLSHIFKLLNQIHTKKESSDKFVKYLVKMASSNEEAKVWLFKHKVVLNEVLAKSGYKIA